ncbi:sensor histidine kinase [Streptomyces sp. NPDC014006]|uniref:sensor histidine kinase n=1 Tax=Streptomyces sp. NPDC014006 TaxID=3364870 RepID=UPI0036FB3ADE
MSRLSGVTESGVGRVVLRWLRVLRDDLWTMRADPLPPFVWLRWFPHGLLCLVAFGVTFGAVAQLVSNGGVGGQLAFLIGLAQGGAVVFALWRPVPAWWLSMAGTLVGAVEVRRQLMAGGAHDFTWPWSSAGIIGHMTVLLLLALRVRTRVSVEALAVTALFTYVAQGVWGASRYTPTGLLAVILSTVVVVLGVALRGRREARAQLEQQTTLTAEERARRALLEERNRIARELHDVVAHHMSVISIQAQVAPHLVKDPPQELRENLAGIRQNALEALTELRRVLGVLRSELPEDLGTLGQGRDTAGPGTAPDAPQPTLDRLGSLIDNTRAAGLEIRTDIRGDAVPYPPGVELSAFRIVQEALSNVLKHAPGAAVRVEVVHFPDGLYLGVTNSRPTRPATESSGSGHGLLGMRERATMLGGHVIAHPTLHGGFAVSAFLPRDGRPFAERPVPPPRYDVELIFPTGDDLA